MNADEAKEEPPPQPGEAETIAELWHRATTLPAPSPPYLVEGEGGWRDVSWEEAARRVNALAGGFLSLGVRKGDRVGIMARTRLEWALCDFALASIGAVVVGVYTVSSPEERLHILADSGTSLLVAETVQQFDQIKPALDGLPALGQVVAIEDIPGADMSLDELERRGEEHLRLHNEAVAEARAAVTADDLLAIVYTSGTTGPPRGCMLTHRNWCSMIEGIVRVPGLVLPGDRIVLHLPLAHVFARVVSFLCPRLGLTLAFCPTSTSLSRALRDVRPTIVPSVPRVYETVYDRIRSTLEESVGMRRRLLSRALAAGREASRRRQAGERLGPKLKAELALADRLVYSKVRARFGGKLRVAVSGGAALPSEVAEFLHALGILVLEGYGLTEATAVVSVNQPDRYRFGTVGIPVPGVDVRIDEDGEILVRGDTVFRGYYADEEATREILTSDGWLRTGDLGELEDGFLTILDRKKDIIVTSNGANIAPQPIERALSASKYISQALVVGDGRPHIAALITVDRAETGKVARSDEEVRALVAEAVADVNRELGWEERIRRFTILEREFDLEEGEVTPTLKLRRRVLEKRFRDEIEALFATSSTPQPGQPTDS